MARKTNRREFVQVAGLAALRIYGGCPSAGRRRLAVQPQARPAPSTMGARFRALLNGPEPLICPGAYDVLTARLIEVHGFKGAFVGSSAVNQELLALPDQAIVTVSEIIDYNSVIASNVDIPVLADVDDFGATPLNVYRFAKQAERGGIGCAAFDDRMPLNRATAYSVPGVFPKARMIDKFMPRPTRGRIWFLSRAASLRLRTIRTPRCWTGPPPMPKPVLTPCGLDCQPRKTT